MPINKKTHRLSIYLIKDNIKKPEDAVINGLNIVSVSGGSLFYSDSNARPPKWLGLFPSSDLENLFSSSASAVLIVKAKNRFFALTFGPTGRHYLRKGSYVERFGLITTLNSVKEDSLKCIDTKTLESEGIQTRIQSSKPVESDEFGLDVEKDLVRSIVGESKILSLGNTLIGKDSLRVAVKCDAADLEAILGTILTQYNKDDYKRSFPWIDNLKEINDPQLVKTLNGLLIEEIKKSKPQNLWLTVPEILDWSDHGGFKYSQRIGDEILDDIHFDSFKGWLNKKNDGAPIVISDLKSNYVCRFSAENDYEKDKWRVYDCAYFECHHSGATYFLTSGKWYEVKNDLVSAVNRYWDEMKKDAFGLNLIDYDDDTENDYNLRLASSLGALCLDQANISIEGRSRFEFCDVYTEDRQLIHVKRYSGSSVLSHLFNQGYVSAEMLFDPGARAKINQRLTQDKYKIKNLNNRPNTNGENYSILFAIVRKSNDPLTLPFFSKLTLMNVSKNLKNRGYEVSVVKVNNLRKLKSPS